MHGVLRNLPHCADDGRMASMIRASIMEIRFGDLTTMPKRHRGLEALEWTSARKGARQRAAGTSCDSFEGDQDDFQGDTHMRKGTEETTISPRRGTAAGTRPWTGQANGAAHIHNALGPVAKALTSKRQNGRTGMVVVNSSARPA